MGQYMGFIRDAWGQSPALRFVSFDGEGKMKNKEKDYIYPALQVDEIETGVDHSPRLSRSQRL